MLLKHMNRNKYRNEYDNIFGKKKQYKFDSDEAKPKVIKKKYGKVRVENIKTY